MYCYIFIFPNMILSWQRFKQQLSFFYFTLHFYILCSISIQSAKILFVPPKYEIIVVPSNYSFFQYCDSNIGQIYIAPCKVIAFNLFCFIYGISSLLLFLIAFCLSLCLSPSHSVYLSLSVSLSLSLCLSLSLSVSLSPIRARQSNN